MSDADWSRWALAPGPTGTLWCGAVDLAELAETCGTALHVVDEIALREDARRAAAASLGPAPDVFVSYKTNPVPEVLRCVHEEGIGAEVISEFELWLATSLGVDPARIIYNGPAKSAASLRQAVAAGILVINANSAGDLRRIAEAAQAVGRRARVGIRVALRGTWGGQFGLPSVSGELIEIIEEVRRCEHLELCGLHFHRGASMRSEAELLRYIAAVRAAWDRIRTRSRWQPELIDMGGSLACPTVYPYTATQRARFARGEVPRPSDDDPPTIADAVRLSNEVLGDAAATHGVRSPRIVWEPGRALLSRAQLLSTSVVDVKHGRPPTAILDAGIGIAAPVPGEYHHLLSVTAPEATPASRYRLAGPICTPDDVLYERWSLPVLEPGHVLAVMDAGAYFVPFSTTFSFPRPAIVMHDRRQARVVRRRESFADMVGLDVRGGEPITSARPSEAR